MNAVKSVLGYGHEESKQDHRDDDQQNEETEQQEEETHPQLEEQPDSAHDPLADREGFVEDVPQAPWRDEPAKLSDGNAENPWTTARRDEQPVKQSAVQHIPQDLTTATAHDETDHARPHEISGHTMPSKGAMPCPDPSVHHKDTHMQEQASKAALYVTHPEHATEPHDRRINPLDPDGKLSSASAATSLKYARPQDLPSFPVVGVEQQGSGLKAATLANKNRHSVELWKPDASSAAGKAATLANDYKMAPLWRPEASAAGSKAALLAAKEGGKLNLWQPHATAEGNSAAGLAMRNKNLSPKVDYGVTEDGRKWALKAATGSVKGRNRSGSTPTPISGYPDAENAKYNALNAATSVHKGSIVHMPREMYTSTPPVEIEVEEARHQAALRASAISYAKQMYAAQNKAEETVYGRDHTAAAARAHGRAASVSGASPDIREQAKQYINLQETARKLAAERLAKLEPDEDTKFRSYYGYDKPRSRLSIRGRTKRRASSAGATVDSDDEEQARRIRNQTSQLSSNLSEIDKKRTSDRSALMAAAEKRVQSRMHALDEKVFNETGKVSPAMMEEWEAKARAKAEAESKNRMVNHGRVHVGSGRYLDQSEIDEIARQRIQPTLDQITDKAEKQRAMDEEKRHGDEQRKRQTLTEKEKTREDKNIAKRTKGEEKAAEKARKAEEKARRKEEKIAAKEAKRRSRHGEEPHVPHDPLAATVVPKDTQPDHHVEEMPASASTAAASAPREAHVEHEHPKESHSHLQPEKELQAPRPQPAQRASYLPSLEQHISAIPANSSGSSISSDSSSDIIEGDDAEIVAQRVLTAPVTTNQLATATHPLATTADTAETTSKPLSEVGAPEITSASRSAVKQEATTSEPRTSATASRLSVDTGAPVSKFETNTTGATAAEPPASPSKRGSTSGGFLGGLLGRLKPKKKNEPGTLSPLSPRSPTKDKGFHGGASYAPGSSSSQSHVQAATASGAQPKAAVNRTSTARSSSISSLSDDEVSRGRKGRPSTSRDSDGEEFEEARDHFDEGLAPPPKFGAAQGKRQSPVRGTVFHEDL